ncbi:MAG: ABC transporter substrate-binding protein [Acidobacteria bacterium]|nr:ABC transporter substrate-binding protein [Acidobacteriota bacterium]
MRLARAVLLLLALAASACLQRAASDPNALIVSLSNGPNNLDPRFGTDDASARVHQLIFDNFMELDEHLRVVPRLAASLEHPDPLTWVATLRRGVRFHDGHELTADDVVFTFGQMIDPAFVSPRKGGYRELKSVEARDPYTIVFTLKQPFASFPINLVMPILPKGAPADFREHPVGTGPYRFVHYAVDDRIELAAYDRYWDGAPKNSGVVLKIVPDDVMRGLELKKGTMDLVVNDLAPDIVHQMRTDPDLQVVEGPGVDYQYIGLNLRDPKLKDVRVRQALACAIDRQAIVEYLRRGLAMPANGMLSPLSWAAATGLPNFDHDPSRARALLDEAGYPDPDGDGPQPRLSLSLKVSNSEFNRLQSSVIQQNLREVGIELDVRTYEFATLYADVLSGNFQLFTLQWTAGALADPDILRRVFHSKQAPPVGFNRGRYANPQVDALLDEAGSIQDESRRLALYADVQRIIAADVPYVGLWYKTNVAVAQARLTGIRLTPLAEFTFLKDVARTAAAAN